MYQHLKSPTYSKSAAYTKWPKDQFYKAISTCIEPIHYWRKTQLDLRNKQTNHKQCQKTFLSLDKIVLYPALSPEPSPTYCFLKAHLNGINHKPSCYEHFLNKWSFAFHPIYLYITSDLITMFDDYAEMEGITN